MVVEPQDNFTFLKYFTNIYKYKNVNYFMDT